MTSHVRVTDICCRIDGAKHSPPGGKFQKSEGPPAAMLVTPFHKFMVVVENSSFGYDLTIGDVVKRGLYHC